MDDWRVANQEEFLRGVEFNEIVFPDFWEKSYLDKNDFYQMIKKEAFSFVEKFNRGNELLDSDKIQEFWHAHCDFCTETITTKDKRSCYCTDDYLTWICKDCFYDFRTRFNFKLK